jgi:CRISPR-associated protein Cas1
VAWKGVHLTNASRLSLADNQLVVAQQDIVRIPLEDIGWIIADDPRITFTSALMSACMEHGIALVVTDARHTPSGLALPFHRHHRQAAIAAAQLALTEPFRKRLWQSIIRSKIANQAEVLRRNRSDRADELLAIAKRVGSGDPENVEARAARAYWSELFVDFRRDDEADLRNKLLNYGYAVARAGVARALVGAGFLPAFGIHHASDTNAFNLADDLFEPFRPIVDTLVLVRMTEGRNTRESLTLEDRRALAGVLLAEVRVGEETTSVLAATEICVASLGRAVTTTDYGELRLPALPRMAPTGERTH